MLTLKIEKVFSWVVGKWREVKSVFLPVFEKVRGRKSIQWHENNIFQERKPNKKRTKHKKKIMLQRHWIEHDPCMLFSLLTSFFSEFTFHFTFIFLQKYPITNCFRYICRKLDYNEYSTKKKKQNNEVAPTKSRH